MTMNYLNHKLLLFLKNSGGKFQIPPSNIHKLNRDNTFRAHFIDWAANQVKDLKDDFVESGGFEGHSPS